MFFPRAEEQRCWSPRFCNVLDKLPKKHPPAARLPLGKIPYALPATEVWETGTELRSLGARMDGIETPEGSRSATGRASKLVVGTSSAKPFQEHVALPVAPAREQATKWYERRPDLSWAERDCAPNTAPRSHTLKALRI